MKNFARREFMGRQTLTTCISETFLKKTHHGIIVWNRNKRLHTINKKHMHKKRKETTHGEIGENVITTSIYIYQSWVQGLLSQSGHKTDSTKKNVSKDKEKKRYRKKILTTSLKR